MKTEYLVIGGLALIALYLYTKSQNQNPQYIVAGMTPQEAARANLLTAGVNGATAVGGAIVGRILNYLNPNTSGVHGQTETNYSGSTATTA